MMADHFLFAKTNHPFNTVINFQYNPVKVSDYNSIRCLLN